MKRKTNWIVLFSCTSLILISGCYNDILDPTQIGRFNPTPKVNVILDSLGVADEPNPVYEGAEEPRPEDLVAHEQDYTFGPGDIIQISIFELYRVGEVFVNRFVVTETGRVSIPDVGIVQAEGLTESQLEQEIKDILSPTIIKNPSVTATLVESQKRYFSVVGQGVRVSGRFPIPRYTFRLTDAISLTQEIQQFNLSYIYVSRDVPANKYPASSPESTLPESRNPLEITPVEPAELPASENEMFEMIHPSDSLIDGGIIIASSEMASAEELEAIATPEGIDPAGLEFEPTQQTAKELLSTKSTQDSIEWTFDEKTGKWIPKVRQVPSDAGEPAFPSVPSQNALEESVPPDYGLEGLGQVETMTRVIRIPVDRLLAGDPRYNIVIRPGDRITVPLDVIGEFWIMGNVNAQGAINLTGRPITLKQAIASAGGLGPLAYPKKVEVIRRLGKNSAGMMQEEIVLVDLDKIAKGLQPDFFIKPNDLINVGLHGTSYWLYRIRTGFRATYGYGFLYDRNFNGDDFGDDPLMGGLRFNSVF